MLKTLRRVLNGTISTLLENGMLIGCPKHYSTINQITFPTEHIERVEYLQSV